MADTPVADTNVLVAAAITPRGLCGRLVTAAIDGRWTLVVSLLLVAEREALLGRGKFHRWLSPDDARRFVANARVLADVVPDPHAAAQGPPQCACGRSHPAQRAGGIREGDPGAVHEDRLRLSKALVSAAPHGQGGRSLPDAVRAGEVAPR